MTDKQPLRTSPRVVTLFCGSQGCCPTVTIDDQAKQMTIADDYGGKVLLTFAQWADALKEVKI